MFSRRTMNMYFKTISIYFETFQISFSLHQICSAGYRISLMSWAGGCLPSITIEIENKSHMTKHTDFFRSSSNDTIWTGQYLKRNKGYYHRRWIRAMSSAWDRSAILQCWKSGFQTYSTLKYRVITASTGQALATRMITVKTDEDGNDTK